MLMTWFMRKRLTSAANSIRSEVTGREWHRLPVVGSVLRWIGRHAPW
jgi:hypothetical protein